MLGNRGEGFRGENMEFMINSKLRKKAEEIARELYEQGRDSGEVPPIGGDESGKSFLLNKDRSGMLVMTTVIVEGESFFLGEKVD